MREPRRARLDWRGGHDRCGPNLIHSTRAAQHPLAVQMHNTASYEFGKFEMSRTQRRNGRGEELDRGEGAFPEAGNTSIIHVYGYALL